MALILFLLSWAVRPWGEGGADSPACIASLLAAIVLVATGWLGGELVSRLGVGVHDHAGVNAVSSLRRRD